MQARLLRSFSRMAIAACALGVGTAALAQPPPPPAAPPVAAAGSSENPSRIDVFLGYSYLAPHGKVKNQVFGDSPMSSINYGAIENSPYFFNKYFGAQIEGSQHPNGKNDDFYIMSVGPVVRFPLQDVTPFAHATVGAVRADFNGQGLPYHWGPSITVGGGMDYATPFFGGKLGLRLFQ